MRSEGRLQEERSDNPRHRVLRIVATTAAIIVATAVLPVQAQPAPTVGTKAKKVGTSTPQLLDGLWVSRFGMLELKQTTPNKFQGRFPALDGSLSGEIAQTKLAFHWKRGSDATGWGEATLGDTEETHGTWGDGDKATPNWPWVMKRFKPHTFIGNPKWWKYEERILTVSGGSPPPNGLELRLEASMVLYNLDGELKGVAEGQMLSHLPVMHASDPDLGTPYFSYLAGKLENGALELQVEEPHFQDGKTGTIRLTGSEDKLEGNRQDLDGYRSQVRLTPLTGDLPKEPDPIAFFRKLALRQDATESLNTGWQTFLGSNTSGNPSVAIQESIQDFRRAIALYNELKQPIDAANAELRLAMAYKKAGKYDEARKTYKRIVDAANNLPPSVVSSAQHSLKAVEAQMGMGNSSAP